MHIFRNRHSGGRRGAGSLFGDQAGCARRDHERGHGGHGLFGGRGRQGRDHPMGEGGGFGAGRRGKRFSGDELRLMVLSLLDHEPQHGYQLIRGFAQKSGEAYSPSPGVLYPLLTLLADMELVEEVAGEAGASRRCFALTDAGRAELARQRGLADAAFERLALLAGETRRIDPAPVRRAMLNLRTAASHRLATGEAPELGFHIAEILDEAARRIEQLGTGE